MLWKTAGQLTELKEQLWQEPRVGVGEDASWWEWERDRPSRNRNTVTAQQISAAFLGEQGGLAQEANTHSVNKCLLS